MNHIAAEFAAADAEFYAPLESAAGADAERLAPSRVPAGWRAVDSGIWTTWHQPGSGVAEDGWKVHVSARPDRLQHVLDTVADVCFDQEVTFKHLSTRHFYWWTHHRHAPRAQSGKFVAAYPPDADAARRLMERLRAELAQEEGPYILTDRRFKDSRTVHYRYGAFTPRFRLQADGLRVPLVRDGNDEVVPDRRGVSFHLPEGVADPFVEAGPDAGAGPQTDFGGFVVESAVRYSNAGGTYRGRELATGRPVFIKEARSHTGLREDDAAATEQLREEWEALTALHALAPGLVPEPVAYFREWEHEFLVTERVAGIPLWRWLSGYHPLFTVGSTADDFSGYYARCEKILSGIESAFDQLHALGYLFVDVSPGNVMIGADDAVRLVDFGAAHRLGTEFRRAGTPGHMPPQSLLDGGDLAVYDRYGLASLAQFLVGPLNLVVQRNPDALAHLHHDLSEHAPIPPSLWRRATRYHAPSDSPRLPNPDEAAADPVRCLTELRDQVADALVAMVDVGHPVRVVPTIAQGYLSNVVNVAYGTAGVVHALRRSGRTLPAGLLERLRADALRAVGGLPPGLMFGTAGIARVLADCGLLDEALDLLGAADRHVLTGECATLAGGSAGVAQAHLALYGHTREQWHVDRALALASDLPPDDDDLTPLLGANDATGLLHGRCGIALMLHQLATVTGDARHLDRAVRLLHHELDRAVDPDARGLVFPVSTKDRRALPYLFAGSAGTAYVVTRCLNTVDDERLAEALPRMLAPLHLNYTIMPGLYQGLAGLAFVLADHARLTGDEVSRQAAIRNARGLFKYAVPHPIGVRYLGDQLLRFSGELWSGSAGVLLALTQVLTPRSDGLFAIDALDNLDNLDAAAWRVDRPDPETAATAGRVAVR